MSVPVRYVANAITSKVYFLHIDANHYATKGPWSDLKVGRGAKVGRWEKKGDLGASSPQKKVWVTPPSKARK